MKTLRVHFRDYKFEIDDAFDLYSAALCDLLDPNEPAPRAQPQPASQSSPVISNNYKGSSEGHQLDAASEQDNHGNTLDVLMQKI